MGAPPGVPDCKLVALKNIYTSEISIERSIVFVSSRNKAREVADLLASTAVRYCVSYTHGGLPPAQRDEEFRMFLEGATNVLVCTQLGRGVNIPGVRLLR